MYAVEDGFRWYYAESSARIHVCSTLFSLLTRAEVLSTKLDSLPDMVEADLPLAKEAVQEYDCGVPKIE